MQAAIGELQRLIQQHYPEATIQVEPGDDPAGMYAGDGRCRGCGRGRSMDDGLFISIIAGPRSP
jgi:hypothetical protein